MIKKYLCFLFIFFFAAFGHNVYAASKITNGIDANFPPFAYIDKSGNPSGFDVEVMDLIAQKIGVEVSHKPIEWDGIITSLVNKNIDIIASGMSITEKRAKKVNFSIPYWVIKQVMVTKKECSLNFKELLTTKKVIGVQQGTSEAKWLKEEAPKQGWNFEFRYYSSSPLAVEDVLNGRIDGAVMNDAPAKDAVSKKDVKIAGTFENHKEEFGYAVHKDNKELLGKVNAALNEIMASPDWQRLIEKYKLNK